MRVNKFHFIKSTNGGPILVMRAGRGGETESDINCVWPDMRQGVVNLLACHLRAQEHIHFFPI